MSVFAMKTLFAQLENDLCCSILFKLNNTSAFSILAWRTSSSIPLPCYFADNIVKSEHILDPDMKNTIMSFKTVAHDRNH